jgi:hypothetical protein
MWLEPDDGKTVQLKRGDIVVQNGTRHAGRNKGTERFPCAMRDKHHGRPLIEGNVADLGWAGDLCILASLMLFLRSHRQTRAQ